MAIGKFKCEHCGPRIVGHKKGCPELSAVNIHRGARPMSEWQPIETAPKDGTWVLLTGGQCEYDKGDNNRRPVTAQWTTYLNGSTNPAHGRWQFAWYDGGYYGKYDSPTHWQPLPDPPCQPTEGVVWSYIGDIYVRPVGRGICLEGLPNHPQIEDVLPEGDFHAEIVVRRKQVIEPIQPTAET